MQTNHEPIILYVEDEPLSRQVMEMLLTRILGYKHIAIFEDSSDFLTRLRALVPQPNIILLDIHMRPDDGFAVLSMLRREEQYHDVKVVACTASVMNEEVATLQQANFDGCISKPIDADYFREFVSRVLEGEHVWHVA
jgi:CheY-like chemotaxis protein